MICQAKGCEKGVVWGKRGPRPCEECHGGVAYCCDDAGSRGQGRVKRPPEIEGQVPVSVKPWGRLVPRRDRVREVA